MLKSKPSKSAKCEGKAIPGLSKVRKWKYADKDKKQADETPSLTTEAEDEEYILGMLLKKSLVNGAMKHDTIVDACRSTTVTLY